MFKLSLGIVITVGLVFAYEQFRYKGSLIVSYEVEVQEESSQMTAIFELHNTDWRVPLSSLSLHLYDHENQLTSVELSDPERIKGQRETFGEHSVFVVLLPNNFVLKGKERRQIAIEITAQSPEIPREFNGYFRMIGATGDGIIKGQHSNTKFHMVIAPRGAEGKRGQ